MVWTWDVSPFLVAKAFVKVYFSINKLSAWHVFGVSFQILATLGLICLQWTERISFEP